MFYYNILWKCSVYRHTAFTGVAKSCKPGGAKDRTNKQKILPHKQDSN